MTVHLYTQSTTQSPSSSSSSSSSSHHPTDIHPLSEMFSERDIEQSIQSNLSHPVMMLPKENQSAENVFETHEVHIDDLFQRMLYV